MPATTSLLSQTASRKRKLTDDVVYYKPVKKSKSSSAAVLSTRNDEDCVDSAAICNALQPPLIHDPGRAHDRNRSSRYDRCACRRQWRRQLAQILIGRHPKSDYVIPDKTVSSKHCVFHALGVSLPESSLPLTFCSVISDTGRVSIVCQVCSMEIKALEYLNSYSRTSPVTASSSMAMPLSGSIQSFSWTTTRSRSQDLRVGRGPLFYQWFSKSVNSIRLRVHESSANTDDAGHPDHSKGT